MVKLVMSITNMLITTTSLEWFLALSSLTVFNGSSTFRLLSGFKRLALRFITLKNFGYDDVIRKKIINSNALIKCFLTGLNTKEETFQYF